jgi:hypothetical protein
MSDESSNRVAERFAWEKTAMIPNHVIQVARKVSALLKSQHIPHAVAGGMAVSMHGYDRMTKDVDVLVPGDTREFIEALGPTTPISGYLSGLSVKVDNVDVDFLFLDKALRTQDIRSPDHFAGLPVVKIEPLIVMKMGAGRTKDSGDVVELLKLGKVPVEETAKRLSGDDREDFEALVNIADLEKKGETKNARRAFLAMKR